MAHIKRRKSKYVEHVQTSLLRRGHATNAEIAADVRIVYPLVSDTTVHRITQRMLEDGECQLAPCTSDGSMRFDINTEKHDHFECSECGQLRDITVSLDVREQLQCLAGDCRFEGALKIVGTCRACR